MGTGAITAYIDVAQVVLYLFWIFFFGLIYYLIRENHREGYPMDSDRGVIEGWPRAPAPKTYRLADGREVQAPRDEPLQGPLNAEPTYRGAGSPKLQSLLPMKLSGVAARIAIACARSFSTPATLTRNSSTIRLRPSARTLTAKKRAA